MLLQRYYKEKGGKKEQKLKDEEPDKKQILKIQPKVNDQQQKTNQLLQLRKST